MTVYQIIAAPQSCVGAVNVTIALPSSAVATTSVGAPGTVAGASGVTSFDATLAVSQIAFCATTVNI